MHSEFTLRAKFNYAIEEKPEEMNQRPNCSNISLPHTSQLQADPSSSTISLEVLLTKKYIHVSYCLRLAFFMTNKKLFQEFKLNCILCSSYWFEIWHIIMEYNNNTILKSILVNNLIKCDLFFVFQFSVMVI
jgi:hypothetical protein